MSQHPEAPLFSAEQLALINEPLVQSLLYDTNLLPEVLLSLKQGPGHRHWDYLLAILGHFDMAFKERDELLATLARLYDSVQRGDFETVGVHGSKEAQAAITLLKTHGATFDEFSRRIGAVDKHGNATEADTE